MYKYALVALMALAMVPVAQAANYTADSAKSTLGFSGTHAGNVFAGKFSKWTARFDVDTKNLAKSCIEATFDLASATTGNAMYDGTLPTADWFNVKAQPQARFVSKTITANPDGSYTAKGDLSLRGVTHPNAFNFTVTESNLQSQGTLVIDRIAYGIGEKSDAKAEWVSRNIDVKFDVQAPLAKAGQPQANCQ